MFNLPVETELVFVAALAVWIFAILAIPISFLPGAIGFAVVALLISIFVALWLPQTFGFFTRLGQSMIAFSTGILVATFLIYFFTMPLFVLSGLLVATPEHTPSLTEKRTGILLLALTSILATLLIVAVATDKPHSNLVQRSPGSHHRTPNPK